jgi:threonine aldolase
MCDIWENDANHDHMVMPGMVYLSQPTEYGTMYSLNELKEMRSVCDRFGLKLYIDGARLAYALAACQNDVTLPDLARLCDVFYIGGTKCGALLGEAVVVPKPELLPHFFTFIKQRGALLAKGWLLGLQFATLFEDGRYFELGRRADALAMRLKAACEAKGLPLYMPNTTNQQFVVLTDGQKAVLARDFIFEEEGALPDGRSIVRFCMSWANTDEEADALCRAIAAL